MSLWRNAFKSICQCISRLPYSTRQAGASAASCSTPPDCCACRMVPEMAKKYFPQMALGFDDPRVQVRTSLLPDSGVMAKHSAAATLGSCQSE